MATTSYTQGTAVTFGPATDTPDVTWEFDALADGVGRASASSDLGATIPVFVSGILKVGAASAPTAGEACRLWVAFSNDNTLWPGGLTSSDAAFSDADEFAQLGFVMPMPFDADTSVHAFQLPLVECRGRYVQWIILNDTGVSLTSTTANCLLTMWPMEPATA